MTTEQRVRTPVVAGRVAADIAGQPLRDVVAALFSFDLEDAQIDPHAVERIRERDFDDWGDAATRSGLFTPPEIESLARSWHADPRTLLEALLTDSDDMTRKRYEIAWDSLDQVDSVEYA
ncbi:hypothetical protein [Rhodococcus koreensis]|uniref:hypothetical protein n=1 Tax=Rhodococcus koreensis TaxID=99653 RepID=UPI0036DCB4A2